jgi:UDP-N-acetylglucosamine--N-acetylmuramyl-(pentapeptide) pyrophosphoryl-undecaprenol N-acetylglucosamine transferase
MSCAELAAVGLPAVYVPLPIGNGEQRLNAEPAVAAGGAVMVADSDLDAGEVRRQVIGILTSPERIARMTAAAARSGTRDAAEALIRLVVDAYAGSGRSRRERSGGEPS